MTGYRPLPQALSDPALLLGASAYTTLRVLDGVPLLWPEHRARLSGTCTLLGLPTPPAEPPDPARLFPELRLIPGLRAGLLRVTVLPQGACCSWRALPAPPPCARAMITRWQVHPQLGTHKTGSALPYRLAARDAQAAGAFEGLLRDAPGQVVDGSRSGLLLQLGGEYLQPEGGLPSVTRALYLRELGVSARAAPITPDDLTRAERLWLCGSGVGVLPVSGLLGEDGRALAWTPLPPAPPPTHPALRPPE